MVSKIEKLGQIKNLLALAASDGHIDKAEMAVVAAVAVREGLSQEELADVLANPNKYQVQQISDANVKVRYLKDMVTLMMIDGELHKNEIALCKIYAMALGYKPEVIEAMLVDIISEIKNS